MQFIGLKPPADRGGLVRKRLAILASLGFAALTTAEAGAQAPPPVDWTGPGREWTTATNWSPATVPTDTAAFSNNGAPTAVTISGTASINTMEFAPTAPAYSFTVTNGATFTINNAINTSSPSLPNFQVNVGSTLAFGDGTDITIGSLADGPSGGGTVVIAPTTFGFLTIAGGTSSTFSGSFSGTGSLELDDGATTLTLTGASNAGNIGRIGGDLTLCDCLAGGLTISGGSLRVEGGHGVSVFGGTLSVIDGGSLRIDNDLLVATNMVVSGPGSIVTVDGFTGVGVFDPGPSALVINNGGVLDSRFGAEIDGYFFSPGTPAVTVSGPGSTWNIGGLGLTVGGGTTGGAGMLTISSGGAVNVFGEMSIGDPNTGTSTVTVTGQGSVLNVRDALLIGDPCDCFAGTLTIADGGVVNSAGFTGIGLGSTLNLGTGGLAGAIITSAIDNRGQIVANFTDTLTLSADISGDGSLTKAGPGTLVLTGTNSYTGGTTVTGGLINFMAGGLGTGTITVDGGGLQWAAGNTSDISGQLAAIGSGGATFDTNGNNVSLATTLTGPGSLTKAGNGTLTLAALNTYAGGTTVNGGTLAVAQDGNLGAAGGGLVLGGGTLQLLGNVTSARSVTLNGPGGTIDTNGNNGTLSGNIGGAGGLTKVGAGTLALWGASSYTGATNVNGGTLQAGAANVFASTSAFTVASGATLDFNGFNQTLASLAGAGSVTMGAGSMTVGGNNASTTFSGTISGAGGLTKNGTGALTLSGANAFTGLTTVNAGSLVVNGSLAGAVTVNGGGVLNGTGRMGALVSNGGVIAPGNSIGTLNVNGNFTQNGGTYQVEVNAAGQNDRINVAGSAALNGGTVQVLAQAGTYARNTTYTILNAAGGLNGAYSGVTSNFAFLVPSLSYDANNVYLLLFQSASAFAAGAQTPNQYAVGTVLDQVNATATGDLDTVLNALSALNTQQGPAALNAISGQQYADFGTMNVQSAALFMNVVGQQMALARGSAGGGQRQALAQACDVEACEGLSPWSVWASAIGGLGSVAGNGNSSTLTYNFGGVASGVDYRLDPRFLVGLGAAYAAGNQWVDSFMGRGWTDTVSVIGYGSFTNAGFYADALAGYAWSGNQLQRQIQFPGLQRTANGSAGANQFLGQIETGYRIGLDAPAAASVTPFARLQGSTVTQNAFSEWGANSLSLNVAQQTTNSLRTVFGADLAGALPLGTERSLALDLRLGWLHEYADTGRPITAAFAGAPTNAFTVYGATPQRDAAVIGFSAGTSVADATQLYLRYDGEIGTGASNHTLNLGLRISW
jgi:autotransporter-associated beta strand protein/T5SS/PEP-CTERM-associated repeat protein